MVTISFLLFVTNLKMNCKEKYITMKLTKKPNGSISQPVIPLENKFGIMNEVPSSIYKVKK